MSKKIRSIKWKEEEIKQVCDLRMEGMSAPKISKKTGIPTSTIYTMTHHLPSHSKPTPTNKKCFSKDQIEDIITSYINMESMKSIGNKYNCTENVIKRVLIEEDHLIATKK